MNPARALPVVAGLALLAACQSSPQPTADSARPAEVPPPKPVASAMHSAHKIAAHPAPPALPPIPAPSDVAAPPADAHKETSGLASKVLTKGTGKDHPGPTDKVTVNYTGWMKDGKMFDSSVARGQPATFRLNQVIKGWTEGLQLMTTGEKRRLWIPGAMAYGTGPSMGGAPTGDLVFDVELISFVPSPKPPPVPTDVKAPPATATKTPSGLAYRILKKGASTQSPMATDRVVVNYSGWTTDGKMFDSSITNGEPITFGLSQVIKGWTEGVQLMHVGDTARFWIPANLAYGEHPRPGAPAGMLVFDIELIEIK